MRIAGPASAGFTFQIVGAGPVAKAAGDGSFASPFNSLSMTAAKERQPATSGEGDWLA